MSTAQAMENLSLEQANADDIEPELDMSAHVVSYHHNHRCRRKSPRSGQRQLTFSADLLEKRQCIHDVPYVPPPTGILRVFGVMRLIQSTITTGGHLTPNLHAPREIWFMDRVRLVGLEHKLRLLEVCTTQFTILESLPVPTTEDNQAIFDQALHNVTTILGEQKAELSRPFPNLVPETQTAHEPTKIERDIVNAVGSNNTMGKLTSLAFGLGRMVRKQAVAVVERANSAQFETISKDTLGRYAQVLNSFFNQVQFLGMWLDPAFTPHTSSTTCDLPHHRAIGHTLEATARREIVVGLATYLNDIVCELALRDVQSLLLSYLQRLAYAYGAFTIDAVTVATTSGSAPTSRSRTSTAS
ncbi:Aste57867_24621 [Aphanomyces stellatus]|uniref:Aste57867_24621 protein n=1 Tax=Aphanomyces stellatus TaxID=120398 RepID=A0A485LQV3_9STRA|nr:hypothetical protein As57867_024543 [Aphanomyces stellatus]VFU01258.1 Aste57867_24621 [Aphanomyces stellatus]